MIRKNKQNVILRLLAKFQIIQDIGMLSIIKVFDFEIQKSGRFSSSQRDCVLQRKKSSYQLLEIRYDQEEIRNRL